MKGVIALALKELVEEKFGEDKWKAALKKAGIEDEPLIMPISDVDDALILKIIGAVCEVLNITLEQAADAFGEYWVTVYSQKVYPDYYKGVKNAKQLLLKMDEIHVATTRSVPNAHPPRFEYEWRDANTLIMKYKSQRHLIDFFVGLIRGVGKLYNEDLKITKIGNDQVRIVFS